MLGCGGGGVWNKKKQQTKQNHTEQWDVRVNSTYLADGNGANPACLTFTALGV